MLTLTRVFDFSASHRLYRSEWSEEKNHQIFGKCAHAGGHGHNYRLEVTVSGPLQEETDMVMDAGLLKALVENQVIQDVDHKNFNIDVPWLEGKIPTVEVICDAIWKRLEKPIKTQCPSADLFRVRLWETPKIIACRERSS